MSTLLIYIHLAVVFGVGALLCNADTPWIKAIGVVSASIASASAYFYALYSLWMVMAK